MPGTAVCYRKHSTTLCRACSATTMNVCKSGVSLGLLLVVLLSQCLICWTHTGSHGHGTATGSEQPASFHDTKVVHDAEHIKEHYEGVAQINESTMSSEELEFHYFKLHDFDNNTLLDGLEMYKALTHMLPYEDIEDHVDDDHKVDKTGKTAQQIEQETKAAQTSYYMKIIDTVLGEDDINNDGYLSYAEYVLARRREEAKEDLDGRS